MTKNREGMTFTEWLNAACSGTRFETLSEAEKMLTLPVQPSMLKAAWKSGNDPADWRMGFLAMKDNP